MFYIAGLLEVVSTRQSQRERVGGGKCGLLDDVVSGCYLFRRSLHVVRCVPREQTGGARHGGTNKYLCSIESTVYTTVYLSRVYVALLFFV